MDNSFNTRNMGLAASYGGPSLINWAAVVNSVLRWALRGFCFAFGIWAFVFTISLVAGATGALMRAL